MQPPLLGSRPPEAQAKSMERTSSIPSSEGPSIPFSPMMTGPAQFHFFGRLPPEVRTMIWLLARPPHRFLSLSACPSCIQALEAALEDDDRRKGQRGWRGGDSALPPATNEEEDDEEETLEGLGRAPCGHGLRPGTGYGTGIMRLVWRVTPARFAVPPLLHACRESRALWLPQYEKLGDGGRELPIPTESELRAGGWRCLWDVPGERPGDSRGGDREITPADFTLAVRGVPFVDYSRDVFMLPFGPSVDGTFLHPSEEAVRSAPRGSLLYSPFSPGAFSSIRGVGFIDWGVDGSPEIPENLVPRLDYSRFLGWDRSRIRHIGWFEELLFHQSRWALVQATGLEMRCAFPRPQFESLTLVRTVIPPVGVPFLETETKMDHPGSLPWKVADLVHLARGIGMAGTDGRRRRMKSPLVVELEKGRPFPPELGGTVVPGNLAIYFLLHAWKDWQAGGQPWVTARSCFGSDQLDQSRCVCRKDRCDIRPRMIEEFEKSKLRVRRMVLTDETSSMSAAESP